ncbi:hypothetical protein K492DRAFT_122105 [Lichtheimia hyalospora FSU 10163]|nr:hypothetical protein K492DRAFT_122105 [Lichtheimia hyalospora FSU 10163]
MLVTENDQLRTELQEQKRQFEEHKQQENKDVDHEKLQAQLRHSQDQVRVLKATMEQFLRMGIFSEDASVYQDIASRFSTQLKASPVECIAEQRQQQQVAPPTPPTPAAQTSSTDEQKQQDRNEDQPKNKDKEIKSPADLDMVLRDLTREKEILQSEYSKIPISGVNALTRRRKEELEERLDAVDSQMSKTKLKYRDLLKK